MGYLLRRFVKILEFFRPALLGTAAIVCTGSRTRLCERHMQRLMTMDCMRKRICTNALRTLSRLISSSSFVSSTECFFAFLACSACFFAFL